MVEADAADDVKGLALQGAINVNGLFRPMLHQAVPQALSNLQDSIKAVPAQPWENVKVSVLPPPWQMALQALNLGCCSQTYLRTLHCSAPPQRPDEAHPLPGVLATSRWTPKPLLCNSQEPERPDVLPVLVTSIPLECLLMDKAARSRVVSASRCLDDGSTYLMFSGLNAGETPLLTTLCQGSADFAEIRQGCGG